MYIIKVKLIPFNKNYGSRMKSTSIYKSNNIKSWSRAFHCPIQKAVDDTYALPAFIGWD